MLATETYGPLKDIVGSAGAIISAGGAITLSWRGRFNWEPSEQDIPAGARKVGGLVASVLIALMWATWRNQSAIPKLEAVALTTLGLTVVFLVLYGFLVGLDTYNVELVDGSNKRIVGGFWLTAKARKSKSKSGVTTQVLLEGAAYDPDILWSRFSRQVAKGSFILAYLGLTICGTLALAAAAIRLGLAAG